jgi:hypothetical protein
VNQPSNGIQPFQVVYSERCRAETKQLLARAGAKGRLADVVKAIRDIDTRLRWIPLDFGEPLQDYVHLGIKEHIGVCAPLVVKYGVDEARRIVYVSLPFDLLPRSGF